MTIDPASVPAFDGNPLGMLTNASLLVKLTAALLAAASLATWTLGILKLGQLRRLRLAQARFDHRSALCASAEELFDVATEHRDAPGARIVVALGDARGRGIRAPERLRAIADRVLVDVRHAATEWLSPLGSIAATAPFLGLFGTVYGIMDAFMRIGAAESASLPVVAPAIGEALVTTAIGLAAAIPAVLFHNAIERRVDDLLDVVEGGAGVWIDIVASSTPLSAPSSFGPPRTAQYAGGGRG